MSPVTACTVEGYSLKPGWQLQWGYSNERQVLIPNALLSTKKNRTNLKQNPQTFEGVQGEVMGTQARRRKSGFSHSLMNCNGNLHESKPLFALTVGTGARRDSYLAVHFMESVLNCPFHILFPVWKGKWDTVPSRDYGNHFTISTLANKRI